MENTNEVSSEKEELTDLKRQLSQLQFLYEEQTLQNRLLKEKTERNERMFKSLVEAAAGKIGQDFFDNIILRLSDWLGAECVLIGKMIENERIEAIPLLLDGKISHGFSYELAGSPCDITTRKGYCCYTSDLINQFPTDKILIDLQAESYIGSALYDKNGITNGVICAVSRKKLYEPPSARDILKIIGARVTAELERQKVEDKLRESNNAKDKFFSIMAHDLQNPLNIILGFSELLDKKYELLDDKVRRKYIQHISQASLSMTGLVSNLLTWSLTQRGMIETYCENVLVRPVVLNAIQLLTSMAEEKKIAISEMVSPDIEVHADKNMLATIIRNLLSNAIKFTEHEGSVKIIAKENNAKIQIEIEDSGIGIEPERIKHIFNVNEYKSTTGTNMEKGSGLGLVLCKEFIEKQNGTIWVEPALNKGTKFIFTLSSAKK